MYYHNYNIKQDIRFGEGVEYKKILKLIIVIE